MVGFSGYQAMHNTETSCDNYYQTTTATYIDTQSHRTNYGGTTSNNMVINVKNNYTQIWPNDVAIVTSNDTSSTSYHWYTGNYNDYIEIGKWFTIQTPEMQKALAEAHAKWQAEEKQREAARLAIERKAGRLLHQKLTTRQRKTYERLGFFDVPSPTDPAVAYRIPKSDLILLFRNGKPENRLCVHPKDMANLPRGDRLVGLKMFIEADEAELLAIANKHQLQNNKLERLPLFI